MALSWNEIKQRAAQFAKEWEGETSEDAEAKSFWDGFFHVFGIPRRRVASFEQAIKKLNNKQGYIDLLWKGTLLVEHKSKGKDLDRAYKQARDYFPGIKDSDLPKYILVSDFESFRLYDLDNDTRHDFRLAELLANVHLFSFIAGYQKRIYKEQDPVNIHAAEMMGRLHDQLKAIGYEGHRLELYLVRLLFCLFADDTTIFDKGIFYDFLNERTSEDGSDLARGLAELFEVLDTLKDKRMRNLDEQLNAFSYVNGKLFEEHLPIAHFDSIMRQTLLDCSALDWGKISPAIFGSLFQSVMNAEARRNLGAHYTSEKNILKLIKPLFMDALWEEFRKIESRPKMQAFHDKLRNFTFLDPACGCGNFLIIAYRELRLLELEVIKFLLKEKLRTKQAVTDIGIYFQVNVDQFYGIEYEEFPAQIAQVAMWLIDHQMNMLASEIFGEYYVRLPLRKSAVIVHGNALRIDWKSIASEGKKFDFILGNPPFKGSKLMNELERKDIEAVFAVVSGAGTLDYVAGWYGLAASYLLTSPTTRVGFVSTSSVVQGEQVGIIWGQLLKRYGLQIHFAHQTFQWTNEAKGIAAVHCIIAGFGMPIDGIKRLFLYNNVKSEPLEVSAQSINAYLIDGPDVIIQSRQKPLCSVPEIGIGNKPIDGGNYLFTTEEKKAFLKLEPGAKRWFRRWLGSDEFINGWERWCLWLGDCPPEQLKAMPEAMKRIKNVKEFRLKSKSAPTRKLADTPTRFHVENMPASKYLIIPEVSSEKRLYIPIGFETPRTLTSNLVKIIPNATLYHFGVLTSKMHMSWIKYICGRLKSDFRYSKDIVYNNFPWPENPSDKNKKALEAAAQKVLDTRAQFSDSSLAVLYDPLSMPAALTKAHAALDKSVNLCYRPQPFPDEARRMEFLFELYDKYTTGLFATTSSKPKKQKQAKP